MDVLANPVVKSFLAGSFSGTCSTILFQPLDLVKTRIQQTSSAQVSICATGETGGRLVVPGPKPSIYSTLRVVIANENISGLWRGITPSITRTVPGVGLYFASLHWLKTKFGGDTEKPHPLQAICLGMAARTVAGCVMIPITVLKTRFESGQYNYTKMSSALLEIYSREGVRGLCCGLTPTLVRDAPYSGLYLMFYTQLKQHVAPQIYCLVPNKTGSDNVNGFIASVTHFSCGITAGLLASLVSACHVFCSN
jgi:solute carrier family 25 protein 38